MRLRALLRREGASPATFQCEGIRGAVLSRLRKMEARHLAFRRVVAPALAAAAVLIAVLGIVVARHGFQESVENAPPLALIPTTPGVSEAPVPGEPEVNSPSSAVAAAPDASRDPASSATVPVVQVVQRVARRPDPEIYPVKTSEGVVLTWKGAEGRSEYRVLRSNRPDFATAEVEVVAGTKWVDRAAAGGSRVTYYRIE